MQKDLRRIINVHSESAVILVADDDEDDQLFTRESFVDAGFSKRVFDVRDGQELLDYLKGKDGFADREKYPLPHIVLLDLNMPRMNGYEALQKIRTDSRFDRIVFLILTTSSHRDDVLQSYRLKADRFLTKPVNQSGQRKVIREMERYWFELSGVPA